MSRTNPGVSLETCISTLNSLEKMFSVCLPEIFVSNSNLLSKISRNKNPQIEALMHAVTCLDLISFCGENSTSNLQSLCHKAIHPIGVDVLTSLNLNPSDMTCAAVCVDSAKISKCVEILNNLGSSVAVAAVATGSSSEQYDMQSKLEAISSCKNNNAQEIEVAINPDLVLTSKWKELYEQVKCFRSACGDVKLRTIVPATEIRSFIKMYRTSIICMAAGSDFIKASVRRQNINATLSVGTVMTRAIRDYYDLTGYKVGFKTSDGIRTAKDLLIWQALMTEELGGDWLFPSLFRIGACNQLEDFELIGANSPLDYFEENGTLLEDIDRNVIQQLSPKTKPKRKSKHV